jgi:hypothetical protein
MFRSYINRLYLYLEMEEALFDLATIAMHVSHRFLVPPPPPPTPLPPSLSVSVSFASSVLWYTAVHVVRLLSH